MRVGMRLPMDTEPLSSFERQSRDEAKEIADRLTKAETEASALRAQVRALKDSLDDVCMQRDRALIVVRAACAWAFDTGPIGAIIDACNEYQELGR